MTWRSPPPRPNVVPGDGSQQELIEEAIGVLETALQENDKDNILFLWTGGKEANVIADLLLYTVGKGNEKSPVPFGVIDTGNQYDEMYNFRNEYTKPTGDKGRDTIGPPTGIDEVITEKYDKLLDYIINNDSDPRGYHGGHELIWNCPNCEATISKPEDGYLECQPCGYTGELHDIQKDNIEEDEWTYMTSCAELKIEPICRFIEDHGYEVLITGRRGEDPIIEGSDVEFNTFVERTEPTRHDRYNPLANWSEENVYAYIKQETVSLPKLYTEEGFRHTDAKCCIDEDQVVGEYGRAEEKVERGGQLEELGYV